MDAVTAVVAALGAGAAAGLSDTTAAAVKDAYTRLKELAAARVAGNSAAELVLARHEYDPAWKVLLAEALLDNGADNDAELLEAAQRVLGLLAEGRTAKYNVVANDSQGVQVGDHGRQRNRFGP
ncbi:hypothetical protein [Actinomadura formosensis]|uniref:hypothetical protein n=1 Tax=Actinomadura formosensis TaxID=60706 RepID=UPI003D91C6CE